MALRQVLAFIFLGLLLLFATIQTRLVELGQVPTANYSPVIKQYPLPSLNSPQQFGVYIEGSQMADAVNEDLGAGNLSLMGIFEHWKQDGISSVNKLASACKGGFTPLISWESWGGRSSGVVYELEDIAAGKHDDLILNYFKHLKEICGDNNIIIRFNHEMEMRPTYGYAWTPWQGKPEAYTQSWRHVVDVARANNFNNLKWLWSPNRADEYVYDYYPGETYVDYVGMTLNHPTITGKTYNSFEEFYTPNRQTLESFGKPIIIGEAAYYNEDEKQVAAWLNGAFDYLRTDKNIVAVVWFNQSLDHLNYSLNATAAGREAFVSNMKRSKIF